MSGNEEIRSAPHAWVQTPNDDESPRPILEHVTDLWSWTRVAIRKRLPSIILVAILLAAVSGAAAWFMPGSYTAHGRILAQSNVHLPVLANPRRAIPHATDTLTRSVAPMVLSERNLERLVDETDLIHRWELQRSPMLKVKDRVMEIFIGPLGEDEKREALIELLRRKVVVYSDDEVVNFMVTWFDPDTPVLLVEHLQDILLDERRARENGVISDALEILQVHGQEVRQEVDRKLEDLREMRTQLGRDRPTPRREQQPAARTRASPRLSAVDSMMIADLRSDLDHARRTYREIENQRQRRLVDLQSTLRQRGVDLGPEHPDILALERQVEALRQPSAEEENLRRRAEHMQAEYLRRGGTSEQLQDTSPRSVARQRLADVFSELEDSVGEEDETLSYARAQLALSIAKYEDILERISGARIELDTANAAFKYRYTVIGEPRRPREQDGPPRPFFILGGLILGVFTGLGVGLGRELLRGRLLHRWQLERHIGLPFLGELEVLES